MRWWPRWYRWTVVIVGEESGNESEVPFMRFRHERDAFLWVQQRNSEMRLKGLTHWETRRIRSQR